MQLEFIDSNVVVSSQITRLLSIIVRIVHLHLKPVRLLEVEVDEDLLHKLGVGCIMDHLRLSDLDPRLLVALPNHLFVEHAERI